MYNKDDAYKALNTIKENYRFNLKEIEKAKENLKNSEYNVAATMQARANEKLSGILWTAFFVANMAWGFLNLIPMFVFAGLAIGRVIGTVKNLKMYDKELEEYKNDVVEERRFLKKAEIDSNEYIRDIDALQDVVHLNKPIEQNHDKIITEWKDVPPIDEKEWEM